MDAMAAMGAASIRHSLRPLNCWRDEAHSATSRVFARENAKPRSPRCLTGLNQKLVTRRSRDQVRPAAWKEADKLAWRNDRLPANGFADDALVADQTRFLSPSCIPPSFQ
jgi:hypothetical protein